MKKFLSMLLAVVLVLSLGTVAFADNQDASFTKTYKITNSGTSNPEETFTFTYEAYKITNSNNNLQVSDMPAITASTVKFDAGTATVAGLEKSVDVALSDINWPGVGIYYYYVTESAGKTAGVTYSSAKPTLKVTVAYDQGTNTYYTAFVSLNVDVDENEDGKTDVKTAGFENTYSAGSLSIKKTVTGNMGDQGKYFAVKVELTGENGLTYLNSYSVTGGSYAQNPETISIGTETTFYLKHDETITISNLPYDVTYTVVEDDYTSETAGAYDAAKYSLNGATATTTSVSAEKLDAASESVVITNNKSAGVDTGISLDSMPYVVMLVVVCAGLFVVLAKKRAAREN
jgi:hypothetical protein